MRLSLRDDQPGGATVASVTPLSRSLRSTKPVAFASSMKS
jgi:hypothetical protein